jgi:ABC-type sugar transport system ATPase subunit
MGMIEIRAVTKRFGTSIAVNRVSASVERGQALCLFGPSGCGKTTLLRMLARLERPDEGEVLIDGRCVNSPARVASPAPGEIGMVFQDLALWPHMRARAHLEFVLGGTGTPRRERRTRAEAVLESCQIAEYRQTYPSELSGGEQQRLAIARALAPAPPLLLLDEPLANLDAGLRDRMLNLFQEQKRRGATIVFATHDRGEAEALGDSTLIMIRHTVA